MWKYCYHRGSFCSCLGVLLLYKELPLNLAAWNNNRWLSSKVVGQKSGSSSAVQKLNCCFLGLGSLRRLQSNWWLVYSQDGSLPLGLFIGLPECPQDTAERERESGERARARGKAGHLWPCLGVISTLSSSVNFIPVLTQGERIS